MNRAQKRQLNRAATCHFCFGRMTQHDRMLHRPPSVGPNPAPPVVAHPKCVAQDAEQRAAKAQATTDNMLRVANMARQAVETAQRAQSLGLWLPGQA